MLSALVEEEQVELSTIPIHQSPDLVEVVDTR